MLGLILDTSSTLSFLCIGQENSPKCTTLFSKQKQSIHLISQLREFLASHNILIDQLQFIAIGTGPGSFLGTRLGVVCAKTISYACKIPLIPFDSLFAFTPKEDSFLILEDAKSKGCYALTPTWSSSKLLSESDVTKLLASPFSPSIIVSTTPEAINKKPSLENLKINQAAPNFTLLSKNSYKQFLAQNTSSHNQIKVSYLRES